MSFHSTSDNVQFELQKENEQLTYTLITGGIL